MTRFCASCGTEVDDTAIFCPTCGQPIDQEVESAIPPAPAWPDPADAQPPRQVGDGEPTRPIEPAWGEPSQREPAPWPNEGPSREEPAASVPSAPPARRDQDPIRPVSERRFDPAPEASAPRQPDAPDGGGWQAADRGPSEEPEGVTPTDTGPGVATGDAPRAAAAPPPSAAPAPSGPPSAVSPAPERPRSSPMDSVPVSAPVTLSGWLIGIGAAIAAIGALFALFDGGRPVVDLLILVAMAGVAVSVFFSSSLPAFGHLRLATLAIVLVAFGAAADRILAGLGGAGELLLFLGAAAAVIGVVLLETGRDQPLGGS
jgi:hypothetical protein